MSATARTIVRFGATLTALLALASANAARAQTQVCVRVKLEIPQRLTFERDAFEATLKLTNRLDDASLDALDVDVVIRPIGAGAPADPLFVAAPAITGVSPANVDGSGSIAPLATGEIRYLLVPVAGAGGTLPGGIQYGVKAVIRYRAGAVTFDAETFEEIITVKPQPELELHYSLPRRVKANTPFELAVQVENVGFGTARSLQIDSAQPRIVENLSGLLISFSLIGTFRNNDIIPTTLTIPFGDLQPGRCGMGAWAMVTTLDGEFVELDATYKHSDELGGELTSLLNVVDTDFLIRRVIDDRGGKDLVFDEAIDFTTSDDGIPDVILESDCTTEVLAPHVGTSTGTPGPGDANGGFDTALSIGWNYSRASDPAGGTLPLLRVTRNRDGKILKPQNAWLDVDDSENPIVSIVDFSVAATASETYTLTYDLSQFDNTPPITAIDPRDPFAFRADGSLVVTPLTVMLLQATDDASGVATTALSIDGGPFEQNRPFFFASGTHTVAFQSEDVRGNLEPLQTVTVIVDTTPPTFTFVAPALAAVHPENLPIAFDFDIADNTDPAPSSTVTVVREGGTALFTVVDGQVLAPNVLTAGNYFLDVQLADFVENATSTLVGPIVVGPRLAQPPRLVVSPVADGDFLNAPVALTAVIEFDDPLVTSSLTLDGAAFFAGTVVTAEGPHIVAMDAEDAAGRTASDSLTFTIDTIAPQVSVTGVTSGAISSTPLAPDVLIDDINLDTSDITLDGAPFVSGTLVDADGSHVLAATATDLAGNTTSVTVPFVVDVLAPRIVFAGFTEGALHPLPVFPTFTVEDATPVTVTALIDGKDFAPGELVGDGDHILSVTALDSVGRTTSATATFAVDTAAPVVRVIGVSQGGVFAAGVSAIVDVDDLRLASLTVELDGSAYVEGTPIVAEGAHQLVVVAIDEVGHETTVSVTFTVDPDVPAIFVDGIEEGITYTGPVRPVVTSDDPNAVIEMTLDGAPYDGAFIVDDGAHTLVITATDLEGDVARLEINFVIDTTPPAIVVTGVVDGGVYANPVTIDVVLESDDIVAVDATVDGLAFALGTEVSAIGAHVLEVVVRDSAGNESRVVIGFTIDPAAVELTLAGVDDGAYTNSDVTLTVTASDAGASIEVTLDDAPYTPGTPISAEGRHVVRAVASVGGVEAAVAGLTFTIDETAPAVEVAGVVDGAVVRGPVAIDVTVSDAFLDVTAALLDGLALPAGGAAGVSAEGDHVVSVTAQDRAGNVTNVTVAFALDQTAPAVAITFPTEGALLPAPVIPVVSVDELHPGALTLDVDAAALAPGAPIVAGGEHTVTAKAVDAAGNVSQASVTFTVVEDELEIVVTRKGAPAVGDRVTLYRVDAELGPLAAGDVDAAVVGATGVATFANVPRGTYRARIEHVWQRHFTPAFAVPGGRVIFDVPDEPAYENVVYVAASFDEGGDGSIEAPFTSLTRAVEALNAQSAAARFRTLIKVSSGAFTGELTLPDAVSVRGRHDPATWAFGAGAAQPTIIGGGIGVGRDGELLDVTVGLEGVSVDGDALVRDVVIGDVGADGVTVRASGAHIANVLVDGAGGDGIVLLAPGVTVENVTVVDAAGVGVDGGAAPALKRVISAGNGAPDVGVAGQDVLSDGVVFASGPLHERYLAQRRAGQDADSAGVDDGDVDAASLDLRGRTTSTTGQADVGAADYGYHAWPVAPPPEVEPPGPPVGPPPVCGAGGAADVPLASLALVLGALALSRRRGRALLAGAVVFVVSAVGAGSGCGFRFDRSRSAQPGDIVGRAVQADGGAPAPFAKVVVDGAGVIRRANGDGDFLVNGLAQGAWVLRFSEDANADGRIDRAAVRAVQLREVTLPGAPAPSLTFVLLGDVPLAGVVSVEGTAAREDGALTTPGARAFILRSASDLSADELGGVAAAALTEGSAEVDVGIAIVDGAFTLADVAPGQFRVIAFDPGDAGAGLGAMMSAPAVVSAAAGGTVDVGELPLVSVEGTRPVEIVTVLAPPAALELPCTVTFVRAGGDRNNPGDVVAVVASSVAERIAVDAPLGAFDVYVDAAGDAPDFHGVLLGQLAFPAAGGPLVWGPMVLAPGDACSPTRVIGGRVVVDRDGDGFESLPLKSDAPELHARCLPSCSVSAAALVDASCVVPGAQPGTAIALDCDDDADGQSDVLEPDCVSLCAGTDLDEDGACDRADGAVVSCVTNPDAGGCESPDGGVIEEGDAGQAPVRRGCTQPGALPLDGVAAGTLLAPSDGVDEGRDDVDGCQTLLDPAITGASDAVFSLTVPGTLETLSASLAGSDFDTVLSLFAGTCDAAGQAPLGGSAACNDDSGGPTSLVQLVDVPAGELFFVVEGYRGALGQYRLQVDGTYALGAACDPARTSLTCPGGACGPDGSGGFACLPPRDCADGIDVDLDGAVDEDVCVGQPSVTCPGGGDVVVGDVLGLATLSASAVDDGAIASVRWSVVSAPAGATIALADATTDTVSFTPLLAGTYRLRYAAADDVGQVVACELDFVAETDDVFRVELLWNLDVPAGDPTDLDLHLLHPTSTAWFDAGLDCHFANCRAGTLSWDFGAGAAASPSLDLDDRDGRGPENVNIAGPEDVSYRIGVHYFADDGFGAAEAFVNVFCFGQLEATLGPVVLDVGAAGNDDDNELWKVADVVFDNAGQSCSIAVLNDVVTTGEARLAR